MVQVRVECALSQFTNKMKLRGVADTPDVFAAIQRDLNNLEKWVARSLADFNKQKCQNFAPGVKLTPCISTGRRKPAGKQLCKKDPVDPSEHQVTHKPAKCPLSKETKLHPRLH